MATYTIREMVRADAPLVAAVQLQAWREAYATIMPASYLDGLDATRMTDGWRSALTDADPADRNLLAVDVDGRVVAIGSSGSARDDDAPSGYELRMLNLLAEAYGTGLADRLMTELVGERGAYLWVIEQNLRARAFYLRHGFIADGATVVHEPSGSLEIRMVRP